MIAGAPRERAPSPATRARLTALLLAALAALHGCGADSSTNPRLVLLYATCTVNKDYLGPYEPAVSYTPALDDFARSSLVFENHQTESGQSGIAFASIFSGTQATEHGVFVNPSRLPDDVLVIPEAFADAGWDVHTWLDHPMASAELNYAQGVPEANRHPGLLLADDPELRQILDRLARDPSYRVLLVTSFSVTHGPYRDDDVEWFCDAHPERCPRRGRDYKLFTTLYRRKQLELSFDFSGAVRQLGLDRTRLDLLIRYTRLLYESRVAHLDRIFGELVGEVRGHGLMDESLIAFTADHGEVLYRDNAPFKWSHGFQLAPEVLGVPLILYGPAAGVTAGRYSNVTRSIDLFPSLAGLAGIPPPVLENGGVSLAAAVRGLDDPPDLVAFSHTALLSDPAWKFYRRFYLVRMMHPRNEAETMWLAARTNGLAHKLVRLPSGEWEHRVFDWVSDPGEASDLFDTSIAEHTRVAELLESYRATLIARAGDRERSPDLERQAELLRSLGYIE